MSLSKQEMAELLDKAVVVLKKKAKEFFDNDVLSAHVVGQLNNKLDEDDDNIKKLGCKLGANSHVARLCSIEVEKVCAGMY